MDRRTRRNFPKIKFSFRFQIEEKRKLMGLFKNRNELSSLNFLQFFLQKLSIFLRISWFFGKKLFFQNNFPKTLIFFLNSSLKFDISSHFPSGNHIFYCITLFFRFRTNLLVFPLDFRANFKTPIRIFELFELKSHKIFLKIIKKI